MLAFWLKEGLNISKYVLLLTKGTFQGNFWKLRTSSLAHSSSVPWNILFMVSSPSLTSILVCPLLCLSFVSFQVNSLFFVFACNFKFSDIRHRNREKQIKHKKKEITECNCWGNIIMRIFKRRNNVSKRALPLISGVSMLFWRIQWTEKAPYKTLKPLFILSPENEA